MIYNSLTSPCDQCPFRPSMSRGFSMVRLAEMADGAFHCHKTGEHDEETGDYIATSASHACAGAIIFLEKRGRTSNMMRVMERLGIYDRTKYDINDPNVR